MRNEVREEQRKQATPYIALVMLLLPYLVSGVKKLVDFAGAQNEVTAVTGLTGTGVVMLVTVAVIATQLAGSALLLSGRRYAWLGGLALAGFTLVATFLAHRWWHLPQGPGRAHAFNGFLEHIALVGALAYVSASSWKSHA